MENFLGVKGLWVRWLQSDVEGSEKFNTENVLAVVNRFDKYLQRSSAEAPLVATSTQGLDYNSFIIL